MKLSLIFRKVRQASLTTFFKQKEAECGAFRAAFIMFRSGNANDLFWESLREQSWHRIFEPVHPKSVKEREFREKHDTVRYRKFMSMAEEAYMRIHEYITAH